MLRQLFEPPPSERLHAHPVYPRLAACKVHRCLVVWILLECRRPNCTGLGRNLLDVGHTVDRQILVRPTVSAPGLQITWMADVGRACGEA